MESMEGMESMETPVEWLERSFDEVVQESIKLLPVHGQRIEDGGWWLMPGSDIISHPYLRMFSPLRYARIVNGTVLFSVRHQNS